ncbi:MAG TPA: urease accessory protein UreD [Xanthobacteraceae bacterium]
MLGAPTAADTFAANRAVGRIALAVKAERGVTRCRRLREQGPLRVRFPGSPSAELEAVIVNTAGGVAGGDRFDIAVDVAPGARLVVTSAAAEKIYRTLQPETRIDVKLVVAGGGSLAWLPQETILFDRSRLRRSLEIDLAADARLLLAEAIVFGRSGMDEAIAEGALLDRWRIRREGALVHAEATRLDGAVAKSLGARAVADGGVAVATVVALPAGDDRVAAVRALEAQFLGEVGASAWNGLLVVRFCARDGRALRHDLIAALSVMHGAGLPRLWLN